MILGQFSDYYHDFQRIACWLLTNSKLYRNEECCLFQQGIPTSLWAKLVCPLEIMMPDHHIEDPYKVNNIFEATKWILKGTNTSTGLTKTVSPTLGLITNPTTTTRTLASVKLETLDTATNAIISMLACMEEHIAALLNARNNAQSGCNVPSYQHQGKVA